MWLSEYMYGVFLQLIQIFMDLSIYQILFIFLIFSLSSLLIAASFHQFFSTVQILAS